LIKHVPGHYDHMHVRFITPWSTLAAHIGPDEKEKIAVIDEAQQSYLPQKVNYYVNGSEKGLNDLAQSFGVSIAELCRWNQLQPSSVPAPGTCLVFYKRGFESEPVRLAHSLPPESTIVQGNTINVGYQIPQGSDSIAMASYGKSRF
jgi:hypothetical protein